MLSSSEAKTEDTAALGLEHRVYIPEAASSSEKRFPAFVMVHGRAGNSQVTWVFSRAVQRQKPVVVSPEAFLKDELGGYSWWKVSLPPDQMSSSPKTTTMDDMAPAMDRLERFVRNLPNVYPVDPERIYGLGFSQGGAVVGGLSLKHPTLFQGVALLSSFLPSFLLSQYQGDGGDLPRYFISHGTEDKVIPFEASERARDALIRIGGRVFYHQEETGHKIGTAGNRALTSWAEELFKE